MNYPKRIFRREYQHKNADSAYFLEQIDGEYFAFRYSKSWFTDSFCKEIFRDYNGDPLSLTKNANWAKMYIYWLNDNSYINCELKVKEDFIGLWRCTSYF